MLQLNRKNIYFFWASWQATQTLSVLLFIATECKSCFTFFSSGYKSFPNKDSS